MIESLGWQPVMCYMALAGIIVCVIIVGADAYLRHHERQCRRIMRIPRHRPLSTRINPMFSRDYKSKDGK